MSDITLRQILATKPGGRIDWGFTCPRRAESGMDRSDSPFVMAGPQLDGWDRDEATCTYCGSLDPDVFMARVEAGDIELGPTDKNYKVYVENHGGQPFTLSYRTDNQPRDQPFDPAKCTWASETREHTKFYFQHLSTEQRQRFVVLLNEKRLVIGYPGGFYVRPFFITGAGPKA